MTTAVEVPVRTNLDSTKVGPRNEPTTPTVNAQAALIESADMLREKAGVAMDDVATQLAEANRRTNSTLVADLIAAIAEFLRYSDRKPGLYRAIAERILMRMGYSVKRVTVTKSKDGTLSAAPGKVDAYRQYATRYIDMARWQLRDVWFTKGEMKAMEFLGRTEFPASVTIAGVEYTGPVQALRDGIPYTRVHLEFKNHFNPGRNDLTDIPAHKVEAVGRASVKTFKVTVLDASKTKSKARVIDSIPLAFGAMLGLADALAKGAPLSDKRLAELDVAFAKLRPATTTE